MIKAVMDKLIKIIKRTYKSSYLIKRHKGIKGNILITPVTGTIFPGKKEKKTTKQTNK